MDVAPLDNPLHPVNVEQNARRQIYLGWFMLACGVAAAVGFAFTAPLGYTIGIVPILGGIGNLALGTWKLRRLRCTA